MPQVDYETASEPTPRAVRRTVIRSAGSTGPDFLTQTHVRAVLHPTYASWANPIEAHFGPLRQFTLANSHHRGHPAQPQALHNRSLTNREPQPPGAEGGKFRRRTATEG